MHLVRAHTFTTWRSRTATEPRVCRGRAGTCPRRSNLEGPTVVGTDEFGKTQFPAIAELRLRYMIQVLREAKRTPVEIAEHVWRAGGTNRFGGPNFRVVWGWSRLEWIGGKWRDRDEGGAVLREVVELREEPKYFPRDRWHLERWLPPENYGPRELWEINTVETHDGVRIPALGPYPSLGDWEHCVTIQKPDGGFLGLTLALCEQIVHIIQWADGQPKGKRREAIRAACDRRQKEYESFVDAVLWNEPRFHVQPYVVVA